MGTELDRTGVGWSHWKNPGPSGWNCLNCYPRTRYSSLKLPSSWTTLLFSSQRPERHAHVRPWLVRKKKKVRGASLACAELVAASVNTRQWNKAFTLSRLSPPTMALSLHVIPIPWPRRLLCDQATVDQGKHTVVHAPYKPGHAPWCTHLAKLA